MTLHEFKVGPGIRHAIIWISIISSFGAGWYLRGEFTEGKLAEVDLWQLQQDIVAKEQSNDRRDASLRKLKESITDAEYDEICGDRPLVDFYK